jgi:hypothetical protein
MSFTTGDWRRTAREGASPAMAADGNGDQLGPCVDGGATVGRLGQTVREAVEGGHTSLRAGEIWLGGIYARR